jgi:hypothetical protein
MSWYQNGHIVDAAVKPLRVRTTILGNWMVPEGYMWLFEGGPQSPGEIRAPGLEADVAAAGAGGLAK